MRAPSTAALLVLASLCFDEQLCFANAQHNAPKDAASKSKAKYQAACPAYEHYSRFPQSVSLIHHSSVHCKH